MLRNKVEEEVILQLARGEMSKYQLAEASHRAYSAVHKAVASLLSEGLIEPARRVPSSKNPQIVVEYYKLTEKGSLLYGNLVKLRLAELSMPPIKDFKPKIRRRIQATIDHVAPRLMVKEKGLLKELKAIPAMYAKVATLGLLKLSPKEISEKLSAFADAVSEGADLAVYPPAEDIEEEAVVNATLTMLGSLLRISTYRQRVAETGRLAVILTMDLTGIDESPSEKGDALFWGVVVEGLRKEGKSRLMATC